MGELLLTAAAGMFLLPMIVMTAARLITGDVPGSLLYYGCWSMVFSLLVAAGGILLLMREEQTARRHRKTGKCPAP